MGGRWASLYAGSWAAGGGGGLRKSRIQLGSASAFPHPWDWPRPGTPPWGASGSETPSCPSPAPREVRTVRLGLGLAGRFLPHRESDDNFRPSPNFLSCSCNQDTQSGVSGLQISQFFYLHVTISEIDKEVTMDIYLTDRF